MSPIDNEYIASGKKTADLPDLLEAIKGPRGIFLQDLLAEVLQGQQPLISQNLIVNNDTVTDEPDS